VRRCNAILARMTMTILHWRGDEMKSVGRMTLVAPKASQETAHMDSPNALEQGYVRRGMIRKLAPKPHRFASEAL
jgi:hypothetical protein